VEKRRATVVERKRGNRQIRKGTRAVPLLPFREGLLTIRRLEPPAQVKEKTLVWIKRTYTERGSLVLACER